ncbi:MAG: DUF3667 domain-containing protein [Niabella sp.]|nr:DUF3667 domain-containing protein [Niabella sp.]
MSAAITCKNCNRPFEGNYCSNCGQSAHEGRIDLPYLLHDIPHSVFHIDRGFFYTVIALFTRPGKMLSNYLAGRRVNYFKPFAYVLLMSTIGALLVKLLTAGLAAAYAKYNPGQVMPLREGFFNHYFSAFIFLMIPLASAATYLFFIRSRYNYWEHVVINTYIAAQLNVMQVLIYIIAYLTVLIKHQFSAAGFEVLVSVFMTGFLYLYGASFGFLMKENRNMLQLVVIITLMNCSLSILYIIGFRLTGIMNPW